VGTLQDFKAELFRTLGNSLRVRIIEALRTAGSMTVTEIAQSVGAEPSNVSQHLSIMRSRGLLETTRQGTNISYSAAEPGIFELLDVARSIFERQLAARTRLLEPEDQTGAGPPEARTAAAGRPRAKAGEPRS
jgi:ArsR family transcriptional regulator